MYHLRKPVDDEKDRIVACVLSIGRHRQSRPSRFSPGNKFLSFLDVKAASQLNSDDLRNVGKGLVVYNSLDIPPVIKLSKKSSKNCQSFLPEARVLC